MSEKTVAQKARVKPDATVAVMNEVPGVVETLGLSDGVTFTGPAVAQLVFVFVNTQAELESLVPSAVEQLASGSALWVFFRKGSKAAGLDVNRNGIWSLADSLGMRPLGLVGVDDTWSAFRLRLAT